MPEDKLFATLDVTTHVGKLPRSNITCLFVDTVGFISDIPTHLIASVIILALCSLLNLILSAFFPFLNVIMNSLLGREACKQQIITWPQKQPGSCYLAFGSRKYADEVWVHPLVGGLHGVWVVGSDGHGANWEHSLVLPFPWVFSDHIWGHLLCTLSRRTAPTAGNTTIIGAVQNHCYSGGSNMALISEKK